MSVCSLLGMYPIPIHPHPYPSLSGGGVTRSSLGLGGEGITPIQPWMRGGYPDSALDGGSYPDPALDGGVTQSSLGQGGTLIQPWMGGYSNLGWGGTPTLDRGVPWVPPFWNSKHLLRLRGGWCPSCVHAGGLSCLRTFLRLNTHFGSFSKTFTSEVEERLKLILIPNYAVHSKKTKQQYSLHTCYV